MINPFKNQKLKRLLAKAGIKGKLGSFAVAAALLLKENPEYFKYKDTIESTIITYLKENNLYEDIFSPCMTGDITVVDTNAILMNAPVTGQDFLSFKITTPGLENQSIDFTETVMTNYL